MYPEFYLFMVVISIHKKFLWLFSMAKKVYTFGTKSEVDMIFGKRVLAQSGTRIKNRLKLPTPIIILP